MLTLIHAAHILLGTVWMVGTLILACAVYPVLARRPGDRARQSLDRVGSVAAPLIGASGGFTLLIGPLRAYLGGRLTSFPELFQPYGLMVLAAFVLVLAATILHGRFRRTFQTMSADPGKFAQDARRAALVHAVAQVVLMVAIIGLMGAMGSGRY